MNEGLNTQENIKQAEAKLAAFLEEFKVLRAKYPEIEFSGFEADEYEGRAEAVIHIGDNTVRSVELK